MQNPDSDITRGRRRLMVSALEEMEKFSPRVLKAMGAIPRHLFVESGLQEFAYDLSPVAIGAGQTISRPETVALETTLLGVESGMRILEIGTGCGYQTAVLYYLGAEVYSIERQEELWKAAAENLRSAGYASDETLDPNCINSRITLLLGDGYEGWPSKAPFDGIVVTCASPIMPEKLLLQLKVNGKMVIPLQRESPNGQGGKEQQLVVVERIAEETFKRTIVESANFVAMLPGVEREKND